MKKKYIIFVAIMLIPIIAIAGNNLTTEPLTPVQPQAYEPSFDALAAYMGYDTDEKFEIFHKTALFMGRYCTTEESFTYIEQMILSGCDPQTTMDIYQFYLTTNEPITIVKQIYDAVYTGEPITNRDIAFENAFNTITNNKCGVLTEEDVINYLELGLSVEDISQANLLSRKGVMTVQEILTARLSGTNWETIVETISGENINLTSTTSPTTLTEAMTISSVTNQSINTTLASNEEERISAVTKSVNETLQTKGYWRGRKSENFEKILLDAQEKGISEEKLTKLLNLGYSETEIMNIINNPSYTTATIDAITGNEVSQ